MIILGVDPGFRMVGLVVVDVSDNGRFSLKKASLVETSKSVTRVSEDNIIRLREIFDVIMSMSTPYSIAAIASEEQSWPRNASSAVKIAQMWGLLVSASWMNEGCPIYQVSPKQLKKRLTGDSSASKEMVEMFVDSIFGGQIKQELERQGIAKSKWNHVYDAAAAAVCYWREHGSD